jgi:hypothetical protein
MSYQLFKDKIHLYPYNYVDEFLQQTQRYNFNNFQSEKNFYIFIQNS